MVTTIERMPDFNKQLSAWQEFVENQEILPMVNPVIATSWRRCWTHINPHSLKNLKYLSADHLLAAQIASFDTISIARPIMEDMYQFAEDSETIIALTNSAGYVLDLLGSRLMLEYVEQLGISTGVSMAESVMGTNAFGLALNERFPASVIGAEHFLHRFHELAEAASPVFDLVSGRLVGVLGVILPFLRVHPHSLGFVVAGARAIEGQRQSDQLLAEQNSQLAQLNAILRANSEGILVWNVEKVLMHANPVACNILGLPEHTLVGRHIDDLIAYPSFIQEALENRKPLTDVDANIRTSEGPVNCVLSLRFVLGSNNAQWVIAILRQEMDVRRLVQSQIGAQAALTLEDIPGISAEMRQVHSFIKSAAPAQASILIRGESGTGKNPVANAIHNESHRNEGPFLIFPCSSVPSELVMHELLGYDDGFNKNKPGGVPSKFELAYGGTLYFQDIDALPLEAQGALLNVIDLGIVQRLGSNRPIAVDVRVIASSSKDMEELITKGNFRSDLFYRLSSFEIRLPPLRERLIDLPLLLERISKRLSKQLRHNFQLEPQIIETLMKYPWPGNIRELEAVLGRAVVQAGFSGVIRLEHLPDYIRYPKVSSDRPHNALIIQPLRDLEKDAILQAAEKCKGNASEMARLLEVGRTTMWRKLKAFNISLDDYRG